MRRLTALILMSVIMVSVAGGRFVFPAAMAQAPAIGQEYANQKLNDPAKEAQALNLMFDLRCVQCQGQSIADSDAPIAAAMRHEVRVRIKDGESPDDIRNFFVSRYGDYISFDPPSSGSSLILWFAPVLMVIIALFLAMRIFRKRPS